jgi:DNA (cytosine-5)-methyltransferase 1
MNTMHLFAGHGGGLIADFILGHNPIVAVEWDKYACKVLRERAAEGWFPNLHVWEGDVRLFDPSKYKGRVSCIHAGFPCTDISYAGKQAGVGEGTRSGLYREVLRIAGIIRPKYLFLENVAAIVTNGLGTVLGDISAMGYDARWCIVSASDVGANHRRERWWCLCHTKHDGQSTAEINGSLEQRSKHNATWPQKTSQPEGSGKQHAELAYTQGIRVQRQRPSGQQKSQTHAEERLSVCCSEGTKFSYSKIEPYVGRVVDDVPFRVDRIKGLGNAQVPLSCATAWTILTQDLEL